MHKNLSAAAQALAQTFNDELIALSHTPAGFTKYTKLLSLLGLSIFGFTEPPRAGKCTERERYRE